VPYERHDTFNLDVPTGCPGVPSEVLNPRSTWSDPAAYDTQAARLARMFVENFRAFEISADPDVRAAGPKV
jgi:phosphoenolpyruvate carboxykinase (ATP)